MIIFSKKLLTGLLEMPTIGLKRIYFITFISTITISHVLAAAVSNMRSKAIHLPAKVFLNTIVLLALAVFLIALLPFSASVRFRLIKRYTDGIAALKSCNPIADSENSSQPPSKGAKPAKNKTKSSNGQPGGQPGHQGSTLLQSTNPDKTVYLVKDREKYINNPRYKLKSAEKRQRIEIECQTSCVEFVNEVFVDRETGEEITGQFPEGVNAPVQYGASVTGIIGLLNIRHFIPVERTAEIINSLFGLSISTGTVCNSTKQLTETPILQRFLSAAIKSFFRRARANFDETGIKLKGVLHWIHLAVNAEFALFFCHMKRGKAAMDAMGILGHFTGFAVHDCWKPYFMYHYCVHCLCNAHIVRELTKCVEMGQKWAKGAREYLWHLDCLTEMHGGELPPEEQLFARITFERLLKQGIDENSGWELARPPGQKGKRGKTAKPFFINLLERLTTFMDAVLRFTTSKEIPFTNNDAERPVRALKIHAKISGGFRSAEYMANYCLIWSYFESCRKHGIGPYSAIKMLQNGELPEFVQKELEAPEEERQAA